MTISLSQVIEAIETADDAYTDFYDTQTGETVSLPDPIITGETDEELEALLEETPDRFLRFPTRYEIHEYSIMEDFVESLPTEEIQRELATAIRGKGALRRFHAAIRYYGIERNWYDYLENAYRDIAICWCAENEIACIEDK